LPRFTSWHENHKLETPAPEGKTCCFATKLSKRGDQHIEKHLQSNQSRGNQSDTHTHLLPDDSRTIIVLYTIKIDASNAVPKRTRIAYSATP
jgi:hypothetical protein